MNLLAERDHARRLNKQAVTLLQEVYILVRNDARADRCRSMSQYRCMLLQEISARIKIAVGPAVAEPAAIRARAADGVNQIEIGRFDQDGRLQPLESFGADQAHQLVTDLQRSISEVIARQAVVDLEIAPSR